MPSDHPNPYRSDILTPRLRLKFLSASDAPQLHNLFNEPNGSTSSSSPPTLSAYTTLASTLTHITILTSHPLSCVYTIHPLSALDTIIGLIGLHPQPSSSVTYHLAPSFRSRGLMTEALSHFLGALSGTQPERRAVSADVRAENIASRRVLEKCGFVRERYRVESEGRRDLGRKLEREVREAATAFLRGVGSPGGVKDVEKELERGWTHWRYIRPGAEDEGVETVENLDGGEDSRIQGV